MTKQDISLLSTEVGKLVRYIQAAKQEIAALRPDEISGKYLPSATDELDAIVKSTAEATGTILDTAEKLGSIADTIGGQTGATINGHVTQIFEVCSFQDITGQRITKVVKMLKEIEARVNLLARTFGLVASADAGVVMPAVAAAAILDESKLLNGPQLPKDMPTQADIDGLFERS